MDIEGKVAAVTGAASGIGRAVAVRLASEGAVVLATDVDDEPGHDAVRAIAERGGRASFLHGDVARQADVETMVRSAEERFGGLDILVNNAGGVEPPFFPESPVARWSRVVAVNLHGVLLGTHHALPALQRRGGGAIVNVASVAGLGHEPHDAPEYAAAKAGVIRFTTSLGALARNLNVRVNCVCPDWVDTPAVRRSLARRDPDQGPPPELVPAEEIADLIVWLILDDSLTGRVVVRRVDRPAELLPVGGAR